MFKKEEEMDNIETVIGPSVHVEGNFVADGDIVIEGVVSGSIKTEKNLHIGQNAKIYADIWAANAVIAGEVQGNLRIKESLELTGTSKVFGDVKTKNITITSGACLHGKCNAGDDKKTKFEKIDDLKKIDRKKSKVLENSGQENHNLPEKIK
jgi:cytoskeletal protein CcmA (bactofilin family)